jgi:hypothetical protein
MVASGCDNVAWGGIDVRLDAPGKDLTVSAVAASAEAAAASTEVEVVELGPLLLLGSRSGDDAGLIPVGHIVDGELLSLADDAATRTALADKVAPGRSFTLFSEGTRVGTFFATGAERLESYCGERPRVTGLLELTPDAADVQRFLALDAGYLEVAHEPYRPLAHNRAQRVSSLDMMVEIIPQVGATWPPGPVLDIRRDIQVFQLEEGAPPAIVVTFVYQDRLRVGPAPDDAYSVFVLGLDSGSGYRPAFVSYRPFGEAGKGAPRYFDQIDWDRDGEDELVLEVLGSEQAWISVLDREDGVWREAYHDPCGLPTPRSEVAP